MLVSLLLLLLHYHVALLDTLGVFIFKFSLLLVLRECELLGQGGVICDSGVTSTHWDHHLLSGFKSIALRREDRNAHFVAHTVLSLGALVVLMLHHRRFWIKLHSLVHMLGCVVFSSELNLFLLEIVSDNITILGLGTVSLVIAGAASVQMITLQLVQLI